MACSDPKRHFKSMPDLDLVGVVKSVENVEMRKIRLILEAILALKVLVSLLILLIFAGIEWHLLNQSSKLTCINHNANYAIIDNFGCVANGYATESLLAVICIILIIGIFSIAI